MGHTKGKIEYTVEVKKGWRILLIDNHKRDILHGYSKDFAESNAKELCHRWNEYSTLKQQRDDLLALCKEFMEKADDGSADFDDPEPGSIYLRAEAAIAKCEA